MSSYGDFQSIFQLAAGLTLGVSGLVTLFEDPVDKEARRFAALSKRARALKQRHSSVAADLVDRIDKIAEDTEDYQEKIAVEADRDGRFWWLKFISFIASLVGLILLIYSSENANSPLPVGVRIISYVLLAYAPVAIVLIALEFRSAGARFRTKRTELDHSYISVVNAIWERKKASVDGEARVGSI